MQAETKKRHPAMPLESGIRHSAYCHPHKNGSISLFSGRCACRSLQCRRKRRVSCPLHQVATYPLNTPPSFFALRLQAKALIAPYPWRKTKAQGCRTMGSFSRATRRMTTDSIVGRGCYPLDKLHSKNTTFLKKTRKNQKKLPCPTSQRRS